MIRHYVTTYCSQQQRRKASSPPSPPQSFVTIYFTFRFGPLEYFIPRFIFHICLFLLSFVYLFYLLYFCLSCFFLLYFYRWLSFFCICTNASHSSVFVPMPLILLYLYQCLSFFCISTDRPHSFPKPMDLVKTSSHQNGHDLCYIVVNMPLFAFAICPYAIRWIEIGL